MSSRYNRSMASAPKVAVFWTSKNVYHDWPRFIWAELQQGRLRQGWAPPGSALTENGRERSLAEWARHYIAGARDAWGWRDGHKDLTRSSIETRYEILTRMLRLEAEDVLLVPRMPGEGELAVVTVTNGYGFDDRHYRGRHGRDLGHFVHIDPNRIQRWHYDETPETKRIVEKFQNYRSAVTPVTNPAYRADILRLAGSDAVGAVRATRRPSRSVDAECRDVVSKAATFRGGPETEEHRRLKEHVARSPGMFDLRRGLVGKIEHRLPSGDCVDVFFQNGDDWLAIEVKSRLSPVADIVRGMFQCVKYRAVIEAQQRSCRLPQSVRVVLVLEDALPRSLVSLKNDLSIEIIDRVAPHGRAR